MGYQEAKDRVRNVLCRDYAKYGLTRQHICYYAFRGNVCLSLLDNILFDLGRDVRSKRFDVRGKSVVLFQAEHFSPALMRAA